MPTSSKSNLTDYEVALELFGTLKQGMNMRSKGSDTLMTSMYNHNLQSWEQ